MEKKKFVANAVKFKMEKKKKTKNSVLSNINWIRLESDCNYNWRLSFSCFQVIKFCLELKKEEKCKKCCNHFGLKITEQDQMTITIHFIWLISIQWFVWHSKIILKKRHLKDAKNLWNKMIELLCFLIDLIWMIWKDF